MYLSLKEEIEEEVKGEPSMCCVRDYLSEEKGKLSYELGRNQEKGGTWAKREKKGGGKAGKRLCAGRDNRPRPEKRDKWGERRS